jgi:type I restriction enzyme, S subunit
MKQDWEVKILGEVCDIYNGSTPLRRKKEFWDNGTVNWFTIDDIRKQGRTIKFTNQKVTVEGLKNSSLKLLPVNSILLCCTASVGEFAITEIELTTNQQFNGLVVRDENCLFPKYVYYFSSTLKDRLLNVSGKTTIDFVSMTKVKQIKIPFPPLPDQKRIVTILDKAFASIAKAKTNAEQNLNNAKELFESYLQGVFENKGEDWEEKTLGDICNIIGGGTPSKKKDEFYNGDILWATVRDMKSDIIKDTEHKITKNAVKDSSTNIIPKKNVIIATRVGLGKVCLLQNDTAINQDLKGIIPKNQKILSIDFLFIWFKSNSKKIIDEGTGATVQGVKLPFIKSLVVHLPPLTEQQAIVKNLNSLLAETKKLETIYQQKTEDLEELKKSVLQKAFNGELT